MSERGPFQVSAKKTFWGGLLQSFKCLFDFHPEEGCYFRDRWIEVNEKKNKPTEVFFHIQQFCGECDGLIKEAYIPEDKNRGDENGKKETS